MSLQYVSHVLNIHTLLTSLLLFSLDKARRQPKPVKPKKMIKVDGLNIVHAACNNGSTALVSKEGELLMFGKDTAHCDTSTGNL
jgi:E3 ubiquitin-protein ligase MYCBP2